MAKRVKDRKRRDRAWRLAALVLGAVVLSIGCSPLEAFYFLWPTDPKFPPECPLVCKDKKETVVVIYASATMLDTRPETYGAEQELAERLIAVLKKRYEEDGEKVKIIPHYRVRDWRNKEPRAQTPYEVGKHFEADKVVYLEVSKMSLYKPGSSNLLFFGRLEMTITVTDMHQEPEAGPIYRKEYVRQYPRTGEIAADGSNPAMFCAAFLNNVANDVSRLFHSYTTEEKLDRDSGMADGF
jgi:hypothetical protein